MLSHRIRNYLGREIVGQSRVVNTLTRTLTVALSGIEAPDATLGIYLFMGPSGTGKTHAARSLATMLHGQSGQPIAIDCKQLPGNDAFQAMAQQIAPFFQAGPGPKDGVPSLPNHSILLIENLEAAKPEFVQSILGLVESGSLPLADGQRGRISGALVLMTSNLCSGEIFGDDRQEIGFSSGPTDLEESEKARIFQICASAAARLWGPRLLGHLDDLIVFHRLHERHLPKILDRLVSDLDHRLARRGVRVTLDADAQALLVARGALFPQHGAWFLVKGFQRFVVFPVADMVAGNLSAGSQIRVEAEVGERLRFSVRVSHSDRQPASDVAESEIPIEWGEAVAG